MNKKITFYPTLDIDQISKLEFSIDYELFYKNNSELVEIESTIENNKFITIDKKCEFDKDEHDLIIREHLKIKNTNVLFGPDGIAPFQASIGCALECYAQKAKFRKVSFNSQVIDYSNNDNKFTFELTVPKRTLNDELTMSVILFLYENAIEVTDNEIILNNTKGVILGTLDTKTLYLSGTGSLFPIFMKPSNDKKLWTVKFEYESPESDKFSESVQLLINTNHKDYYMLDPQNKCYCERLIYEIISSAVTLLILDLKENNYIDDLNGSYADGSILQFIKYCKDVLNIDLDSPLSISSSLREYLDGEE